MPNVCYSLDRSHLALRLAIWFVLDGDALDGVVLDGVVLDGGLDKLSRSVSYLVTFHLHV